MTRILVVDDSADARDITCAHLAAAGYLDVLVADSGEAALDLLATAGPVDAVLLDIMMDGIDGIETCARIRADARHADLPVLMLTAVAEADSLGQAFVAGATDYIAKPVRRVELSARLRSALRLKAELDRRRAREAALEDALRAGGAAAPATDAITGLPGAAVLEAALASLPAGAGIVALLLDDVAALREAGGNDAARRGVAASLAAVPAPLGALLCDSGRGLFAVTLPPGIDAAAFAALLRDAVRQGAIPAAAGGLTGMVSVSVGHAAVGADAREAFARAVAMAERQAAADGDDGPGP